MRALTMRKLGTDLGVDPMALYHHVPGREGLLDGITDLVLDDLRTTPGIEIPSTVGWSEYLHRLGHGMREIAQRHPRIFPLVATRPPEAPWLRPPMRSLWLVESFLSTLVSRGFTERSAIATYRVFSSFLLGHLLLEATARGTAPAVGRTCRRRTLSHARLDARRSAGRSQRTRLRRRTGADHRTGRGPARAG